MTIGKSLKNIILISAFFMILMAGPIRCSAASSEYKQITSSSYVKIGNAKTKVKYNNGKITVYYKKDGKTYKKKNVITAVTNGSVVYYTKNSKLYKWNPVKGTDKKIGKLNGGLVGGTGNILCYEKSFDGGAEADVKLYQYNLNTKKSKLLKKYAFYIGTSGKNIIYEGSHGDPSPTGLYVYNISSKKTTKVCARQRGTTISGNYLYYVQYVERDSYSYIYTIKRYNINTGKKKTLAKDVYGDVQVIKNEYARVHIYYNGADHWYKYVYSTGEYIKTDPADPIWQTS